MLPFKNCFFVFFFHNCLPGPTQTDSIYTFITILYHIPISKYAVLTLALLIMYMVPQLCYACFFLLKAFALAMSLSWDTLPQEL